MKIKLSEKQEEIVNFKEGPLLVLAGPGSGKTRVLIERIKNLLTRRTKILALTFSNLAAEEMKSRLEEDDAIEEDFIDNVTTSTIHSFCLDIVQRRGVLIGLSEDLVLFENNTDRIKMLKDIILEDMDLKDYLDKEIKPDKYLNQCLVDISEQKKKFIPPEMCKKSDVFKKIYSRYNIYLQQQNAIDFDDILFYAYRILSDNPNVLQMYGSLYKYVCVDESQDLNYAQYEVIKLLCFNNIPNIMLVGDSNQSIYGFNGSNSQLMTETFVNDFHPKIFSLDENFRSAKAIVKYANMLENTQSSSTYFYEGELKVYECETEKIESKFVIQKIKKLKQNGHKDIETPLKYDDFAIIARSRYVLQNFEEELKKFNIPYFFKRTVSGIENDSALLKIFDLSLRLFVNGNDIIHLQKICSLLNCQIPSQKFDNSLDLLKYLLSNSPYKGILSSLSYLSEDRFNFTKMLKCLGSFRVV